MERKDEWESLIRDACQRLYKAQAAMILGTFPPTPKPRPRVFRIAPGVCWPSNAGGGVCWDFVRIDGNYRLTEHILPRQILERCNYRPRLILRAVRRIEAAAAWCEARRAGRDRAAQEILRQQARAVEALEAEAAIRSLARGG